MHHSRDEKSRYGHNQNRSQIENRSGINIVCNFSLDVMAKTQVHAFFFSNLCERQRTFDSFFWDVTLQIDWLCACVIILVVILHELDKPFLNWFDCWTLWQTHRHKIMMIFVFVFTILGDEIEASSVLFAHHQGLYAHTSCVKSLSKMN